MNSLLVQTFGAFCVWRDDAALHLPPEVERLVAFLCVSGGQRPRPYVAGILWPDGSDERALANLRSVLWRLNKQHQDLVAADAHSLWLTSDVTCDISDLIARSASLFGSAPAGVRGADSASTASADRRGREGNLDHLSHRPFALEFLPGWYDEWVLVERERLRQLCLHALEEIARRHAVQSRFGAAIQALLASISLDELRESPRRQLISIHLAEGNPTEALRGYDEYATTLHAALGLAPSEAMMELLATVPSGPNEHAQHRPATLQGRSRDARPTENIAYSVE